MCDFYKKKIVFFRFCNNATNEEAENEPRDLVAYQLSNNPATRRPAWAGDDSDDTGMMSRTHRGGHLRLGHRGVRRRQQRRHERMIRNPALLRRLCQFLTENHCMVPELIVCSDYPEPEPEGDEMDDDVEHENLPLVQ